MCVRLFRPTHPGRLRATSILTTVLDYPSQMIAYHQ